MMSSVLRGLGHLTYRFGMGPQPSDLPDHRLAELVGELPPGRALDLGCGTGRNAICLARHGWDAVGVEMVAYAVQEARRKAEGLPARFVQGDVTRLSELDLGAGAFDLLIDGGCYHMIPPSRRDAYAHSVTHVAAHGARLIIVGFRFGVNQEELLSRMPGWQLATAARVPGEQMCQYISGPAPLRAALKRGRLHPMRYELIRI